MMNGIGGLSRSESMKAKTSGQTISATYKGPPTIEMKNIPPRSGRHASLDVTLLWTSRLVLRAANSLTAMLAGIPSR